MNRTTYNKIINLEKFIGFPIARRPIPLELNEPHDETFSYNLCLRFYGNNEELKYAINDARTILSMLLAERKNTDSKKLDRTIGLFYSLIGNMHYMTKDYRLSAGYFMKSLSFEKNDITPWIELLFALRAIGEFELFEAGIFNLVNIYEIWKKEKNPNMDQQELSRMLKEFLM